MGVKLIQFNQLSATLKTELRITGILCPTIRTENMGLGRYTLRLNLSWRIPPITPRLLHNPW